MGFVFNLMMTAIVWNLYLSFTAAQYVRSFQTLFTIYIIFKISNKKQNQYSCLIPKYRKKNQQKQEQDQEVPYRQCSICKQPKPPRYYHCRHCNICIYQMDHHCQWLDCCVGFYNTKLYILSLFHILLLIMFTTCSLVQNYYEISALFLIQIMLCTFGGYQTLRMIINMIKNIVNNQTLIQTYKKVKGRTKTISQKLQQIFGEFSIHWFLPTCEYKNQKYFDIWEDVIKIQEQILEHQYADEYIYGPDDDDNFQDQLKNQSEQYNNKKYQ